MASVRPLLSRLTRQLRKAPAAKASGTIVSRAPRPTSGHGVRGTLDTPTARPEVVYAPNRDGDADPGEIVWTWVSYEEDDTQGKDRPVLIIGHWGEDVAGLALTSRAHDDRHHHPVGVWDQNDGRQSWLKLDRLLRLDPDAIRREGEVLDAQRFTEAIAAWERY